MKNITETMKTLSIFEMLKKYKIKPIKHFGQNFLIDKNVLDKIIDAAELTSQDIVLEIGPGLGILTIELLKGTKKVIAVEKDKKLCEILKTNLKRYKNLKIINEDILKIKIDKLSNYKVVANIPYYLTSPLIRKFLEEKNKPSAIILMVQKEVAQRICASPPHMNLLAIAVQFFAEPKIISYVSKNSFYPMPKVDSAIIKIIPKSIPDINTEKFFNLVKRGFASKRKMLKNNIPGIDLEKIGLNPGVRAENLPIKDWLKLFHSLNLY